MDFLTEYNLKNGSLVIAAVADLKANTAYVSLNCYPNGQHHEIRLNLTNKTEIQKVTDMLKELTTFLEKLY